MVAKPLNDDTGCEMKENENDCGMKVEEIRSSKPSIWSRPQNIGFFSHVQLKYKYINIKKIVIIKIHSRSFFRPTCNGPNYLCTSTKLFRLVYTSSHCETKVKHFMFSALSHKTINNLPLARFLPFLFLSLNPLFHLQSMLNQPPFNLLCKASCADLFSSSIQHACESIKLHCFHFFFYRCF